MAPNFRAGQRVWLATKNLPLRVKSRKLSQKYIGPFRIARKVNPVSYRLCLPHSLRINPTFHVSLLKPVMSSPFAPPRGPPPPPRVIDGQPSLYSPPDTELPEGPKLTAVSSGLGGLRAGGALLGSSQRHPGPKCDPGVSHPEAWVFWKEHQEPFLEEGFLSLSYLL